jgi:BioD-like phosphotransacetylase family protein
MSVLYVTSDRPGVGKTAFCATLAAETQRRGKHAAVFKPLRATEGTGPDPDAEVYRALLGQPEAKWPFRQRKSGLTPTLLKDIDEAFEEVKNGTDLVIVEGLSDIPPKVSKQLVNMLGARVVVLAGYSPGLDASQLMRWRLVFGDSLLGTVINGHTRYRGRDVEMRLLPSVRSAGFAVLGAVPEDRRLLGVSVGQLASHLDGRFAVGEGAAEGLIEHFMVGGLGLDWGGGYFGLRGDKAVIVRGDRPDIQMAALPTPTTCMVLTGGIEPIEYVSYEAEQENVAVMVVQSDTLSTMAMLATLPNKTRFDHPAKLDRFGELLREHVDLNAIYDGLGL